MFRCRYECASVCRFLCLLAGEPSVFFRFSFHPTAFFLACPSVSVYLFVFLSVFSFVGVLVCLSMGVSVCMRECVCMIVYVSEAISVCDQCVCLRCGGVSFRLSVCASVLVACVSILVCLSWSVQAWPFIHLPTHL